MADQGNSETVVITPPENFRSRNAAPNELGAPVEVVSAARIVRFNDLNLDSAQGVDELRNRIRFAAASMCSQLDAMYPVSADNGTSWPVEASGCYHRAVRHAMYQADGFIRQAREEGPERNAYGSAWNDGENSGGDEE